jgi:hypothetical protein
MVDFRPDWLDRPHEEWPESARLLVRLIVAGNRKADRLAMQTVSGKSETATKGGTGYERIAETRLVR